MSNDRKIYSLTQLNTALERHFLSEFGAKNYWVTAELAQVNYKSGSMYLELADTSHGMKSAQIMAYMWAANVQVVRQKIGSDFNALLKPGNKLLLHVKIEFHKIYGLKLNVLDIDPTYSYGEIEREKQATIQRLKDEGLFDLQKKLSFSVLANRIALVGSKNTSGFRDFCETLLNNNAYRNFVLKYFNSSVQGDSAVKELVAAITEAQNYDVDAIVLVRGGGSKMDLHVFNHYEVCKAICESQLPVLTGIGHETDEVVADLVAFQKAITPTACAKHLYMRIYSFSKDLNEAFQHLKSAAFFQISTNIEHFQHVSNYLVLHAREVLHASRDHLQRQSHDLKSAFLRSIANERIELELKLDRTESFALNRIQREFDTVLASKIERLEWLSASRLDHNRMELKNLEDLLQLLNPEKLIKAGYTISTVDDVDVLQAAGDLAGKEMKTLTDGRLITSIIQQIKLLNHD